MPLKSVHKIASPLSTYIVFLLLGPLLTLLFLALALLEMTNCIQSEVEINLIGGTENRMSTYFIPPIQCLLMCSFFPPAMINMTYRDIQVNFTTQQSGAHIISLRFTIMDYAITNRQDPDGKIQKGQVCSWFNEEGKGNFTFQVDRKKSLSIANFWKNNFAASKSTFGHHPDKLNFAFYGTLDINMNGSMYRIEKFGLAQGQAAGVLNNWWITVVEAQPINVPFNEIKCYGYEAMVRHYFKIKCGGASLPDHPVNLICFGKTDTAPLKPSSHTA